jgi:hypothetical protein
MNLNEIIEEIYDGGGGNYPAYSQPPRKDFAPMSMRNGYDYPYQKDGKYDLTEPPPDAPVAMPWPLQTITDDLSDAFVFLMTASGKLSQCIKNNPTLTKEQKDKLLDFYKVSRKALDMIQDIGTNIHKFNIAGPQPSQNPIPASKQNLPETLPDKGNTIVIKIP